MKCDELGFERTASVASVTELVKQFPKLPPHILITLAIVALLSRSVTPFKLCACGCGEPIHGKEKSAGPTCRKRIQRERDALKAGAPKQFNIVLQSEIPVTIPAVPVPLAATVQHSEISDPGGVDWRDCPHKYGFFSLDSETGGYFCDACERLIYSQIPSPPEAIGYLSAIWKDWEATNRFPVLDRENYSTFLKSKPQQPASRPDVVGAEISAPDYPNRCHIATLKAEGATDNEIGFALSQITQGDADDYLPGLINNLRIALGSSLYYEFERLARAGIYPGAVVEYNGKLWSLKRFELLSASQPIRAVLGNTDNETGPYKVIDPSYLKPAASHTSQT